MKSDEKIDEELVWDINSALIGAEDYEGRDALELLDLLPRPLDRDQLQPLFHRGKRSLVNRCAKTGRVELVEKVLSLGLDPNEIDHPGGVSTTTSITSAIRCGNPAVLATLLNAGLTTSKNRPLITSLNLKHSKVSARCLQLLLDANTDPNCLHSRFGNMDQAFTALDFAHERASPQEIIDLLRSYGAKTKDELAAEGAELPREAADSAVAKHFEAKRGEPAAMLGVSDDIRYFVLRPAEGQRGITTLFTDGLARTFLRGERFELYMELEAGFDVDDAGGWPAEWLQRLAELPQQGEHFELPVTTVATSRLLRPFQKGTPYAGWMLFGDEDLVHPAYAHPVRLLRATPLTKPEIKLERKEGTPALMRALDAAGVPRTVARTRDSAV